MEESTVYQVILEKGEARGEARGRVEGARETLVALARRELGNPSKKVLAALKKINDFERLIRMSTALQDVETWNELLAVE